MQNELKNTSKNELKEGVKSTVNSAIETTKNVVKKVKGDKLEKSLKAFEKSRKDLSLNLDNKLTSIEDATKKTVCNKVDEAKAVQKIAKETGNKKAESRASKIIAEYSKSCDTK